ncbi:glyoxylate/hydroxypyruvate reductase [Aphelenchoides avenae]|nr:glyoxylate/hydroxypyruvate reductase [Aphelenchus avenae]
MSTTDKPKVVVTDRCYTVEKIKEIAHVVQCKQEVPSREWLLQEIVDADALYQRAPVKADKELLDKASKLRVLVTISAGYENIDVEECRKR